MAVYIPGGRSDAATAQAGYEPGHARSRGRDDGEEGRRRMGIVTHAFNLADEPDAPGAGLVGYVLNSERRAYNPPELRGGMFDYVLAIDGLYLHAKREELEVCFRIAPAEVRGLAECFENFGFDLPKV